MISTASISPAEVSGPVVTIAIALPEGRRVDPGTARLLEALSTSPMVRIMALTPAPATPPAPKGLWAGCLALEAAVTVRGHALATPAFDRVRADMPPVAAGSLPAVDVVLDLGGAADEALAATAGHGLWRLSAADPLAAVGAAVAGAAATTVQLRCLDRPGAAWRVLADARYDTKFLATRNRAFQREKAVQLIERELARLALGAAPAVQDGAAPGNDLPAVTALPGYIARSAARVADRLTSKLRAMAGGRPQRFCLRLARGTPLDFDPADAVEFQAPRGQYWADPFLIDHVSGLHVFFEVYDYASGRGHIAAGRLEGDRLFPLGPVLTPGYHLSYPFVFAHQGEVFMLPESHEAGRLELWRAVEFPMRWERHTTALEGTSCADSVLLERDGQWWLFTNICRDSFGDFCSELHVFAVDGPQMTQVAPHPLNPVVIGSRLARGAGRVFEQGGRLYRSAQDNAHGVYGYGLRIMEIEELTQTTYRERSVRHLTPENCGVDGLIGLHHVDALDGRVVFDVRRR